MYQDTSTVAERPVRLSALPLGIARCALQLVQQLDVVCMDQQQMYSG